VTKITIEIDDDAAREALEWAGEVTQLLLEIKEEIRRQNGKQDVSD